MRTIADIRNDTDEGDDGEGPNSSSSSAGGRTLPPHLRSGSRLTETTEAYRNHKGTTAKRLENVNFDSMTDERKKQVNSARKKAGKEELGAGNGGAGGNFGILKIDSNFIRCQSKGCEIDVPFVTDICSVRNNICQ
jgi:hypothetical protein